MGRVVGVRAGVSDPGGLAAAGDVAEVARAFLLGALESKVGGAASGCPGESDCKPAYCGDVVSRLSTAVVLPENSRWNALELRLLVDDQDVVGSVFDAGPGMDPDTFLGPDSPLLPADEPRELMLAEAPCTWGCCGAIFVRIHRDGSQVVWDGWRNPDDQDLLVNEVRFDRAQYEAELARAHGERGWEWLGWTVARLLRTKLRQEPSVLGQWNSSFGGVGSPVDACDRVKLTFFSPPRQAQDDYYRRVGQPMEFQQFLMQFLVNDEPAENQAERILAMLRAKDPRRNAEVCGGYPFPQ